MQLAKRAGLLHDIKRKNDNHAEEGARFSSGILKNYVFSSDDIVLCMSAWLNLKVLFLNS